MSSFFKSIYRILLLLIVSLLILGQLQRVQLTSTVAVYLHEIVMAIFVIICGFHYFFQQKNSRHSREGRNPGQRKLIVLPIIYVISQTFILSLFNFQLLPLLYLARWTLYASFLLSLSYGKVEKFFTKTELYQLIIGFGGMIAFFGLVQYLIWPDTRWLINYGWDDHYYRLISTLFDPGFTVLIILLTALFYLGQGKEKLSVIQRFLIIPFFFITILLTYSRAGYVAFVAGLFILSITKKSVSYFLFTVFFIFFIPFLPKPAGEGVNLQRIASIKSRVESNQEAIQQLTPVTFVFGQGMFRNPELMNRPTDQPMNSLPKHAKAPDNSFIFLLSSFGLIGTSLFIPFIWKMFLKAKAHPWLLACLMAWGVHSLFNLSLIYPWVIVMMGMMWVFVNVKEKTTA